MNYRTLAIPALLALTIPFTFAQTGMMKKPMQKRGGTMMMKKSYSGIVKGMPMGMKFMMGSRMGTYTVDASRARVMMKNGMACKVSDLRGGTMVTVMGMETSRMMIMADSVMVNYMRDGKGMKKKGMMKKRMMKPGMMNRN